MQDLFGWLSHLGFREGAVLDGKIHRVSRFGKGSKSAWYIGWTEPFPILVAGDWRTGEKWQWSQLKAQSPTERKNHARVMREAQRAAEAERLARYEDVSVEAKEILRQATDSGITPYMLKKRIDKLYGAKVSGDTLLIPMRTDKLWGLQKIDKDGNKFFMTGQRAKGCYHALLSEVEPGPYLVCEGFATGVSLFQATGCTTLCAFSASNLGAVATGILRRRPYADVIVCADNDHKTPGNPGYSEALTVAKVLRFRLAVAEGRGTDFNDLHLERGLAAVRDIVMRAPKVEADTDEKTAGKKYRGWMEASS